ncbi:MAG: lytic transglycosylase domain-containing protein [Pseudomonadota bacterium]
MSSMPSKLPVSNPFSHPITLAALAAASIGAVATPSSAQMSGSPGGQTMVAQQPRAINAAIANWEFLQEERNLAFAEYANFAKSYPNFPRLEIIRLRAEAALENEAPSAGDLLTYFDALPPLTNPARARYALTLASAQRPEAFDVAREAWRGGAMSGPAEAYLAGLYGSRLTEEDHAARMDALLWQGEREAAARNMINLPEADRPLAMARLSLLNGTMPREAGLGVPNEANRDAGFTFNLLNHLWAKRLQGQAVQLLANRPAFASPAFDPEDMIGDMLAVAKVANSRDTVRIASKTDDIFAPGTDVSEGSFRLRDRYTDLMWMGGTNALWRLGDGAAAAPLFERYGKGARSPLTRSKGFYWAGRAARQAGLADDATRYFEMAAEYPHYYYGQLSIAALGREMPTFSQLPTIEIDADTRAEFNRQPVVQAIRDIAVNRRAWQTERRFFQAVGDIAKTPAEMKLVAELAAETGLEEMAVVAGMKAGEHGLAGFERLGFPTVATPRVNDWTMVHAISRQESEFDRTRVSHAGARGVMQLMPGTAREQSGLIGVQYMSANLIDSPSYNIRLGDAYFARMMDYYGGAYPLAIGAYNAGPGRVNQWLRLNGDPRKGEIDWVTWVEKIPANFETRYYIMRVIGNAVSYSHMYPEQAGLPRTVDTFLP